MADFSRLAAALADRYRIERELGQGGMATVYLAHDLKHDRQVAVKVLRPDLAASLGSDRFIREIQVAARLQHPHILPLHDSGEASGFLYYVMPYVDGESLRERLERVGELPVPDTLRILMEVVDALAHAHAHGVVHRDIKPDNVMLSGRHALVTDFGVAKAVSEATGRQQVTTVGVALGTPAYMAPEQAAADPHLDHRVDIYAVGVLGYELLTGKPPFTGRTPQEVLAAHVTQAPEAVDRHRPGLPPALTQVLMKCLAKRPADRWQTAEELLHQLEPLTTPSTGMTPTETRPFPALPWRIRRAPLAAGLGLVLLLLGFAGWRLWGHRPAGRHPVERIALLPLADETGDSTQILAEGLTREIISALTRARVRITGYASVARYARQSTPLPQVASELNGVDAIAVGSLVRANNGGARLALELLDPATGDNLWADNYAVGPSEIAALANRVAGDLVGAIKGPVTDAQAAALAARPRVNPEAYSEYLLGRHFAERFTPTDARQSIAHLERAVALDSSFANAYAALGYVYASSAGWYRWFPDSIAYPRAQASIDRAFALDGHLGLAYLARAALRWFRDWDWAAAEADFRTAIELEPSSWAYEVYSSFLDRIGRLGDAVEAGAKSVASDPSSPAMRSDFVNVLWYAGLVDSASREARIVVALDAGYAEIYRNIAWIYLTEGLPDSALAALSRYQAMSGVRRSDIRGWSYVVLGRRVEAQRLADSLTGEPRSESFDQIFAAAIYGQLGERDRAFTLLKSATARRVHFQMANPIWDPIRADPRFMAMIRQSGLNPNLQLPPGSTR